MVCMFVDVYVCVIVCDVCIWVCACMSIFKKERRGRKYVFDFVFLCVCLGESGVGRLIEMVWKR